MRSVVLGAVVVAAVLTGCGGAHARKIAYLARGREHMATQQYELARLEFRNAVQLDPNDPAASFLAGQAAQRVGNLPEAVQMYQSAIDIDPRYTAARAQLAKLYVSAGLTDRAAALVDPGLALAPSDPGLLTVRAAVREKRSDLSGARADAQEALRLAPTDEDAILEVASIDGETGESAAALELLGKAAEAPAASVRLRLTFAQALLQAGRHADAVKQMQRVIAIEPKTFLFRYHLAQLFLLDKDIDGAETTLRAAVAQAPNSVEATLALANFLASYRSYDAAEAEFKSRAAASPANTQLRLALAQFYESHQHTAQAEAVYGQIVHDEGTDPAGLAARDRLAGIYLAANDLNRAAATLQEVLSREPRDNDALFLSADLSLKRGNPDAAIRDLRAVERDQPTSMPVQRALAKAYLQDGDATLAEETLRAAVQSSPGDTGAQLDLAGLLSQSGRADAALAILEKLATAEPADLGVLESLFNVQMGRKDYAAAQHTAELAESSHPTSFVGSYLNGLAALAEGQPDAARVALERAAALSRGAIDPVRALVRVDLAQQHPDQALARLDRLTAQLPNDPAAHDLKGEVLADLERFDAALPSFRQAIALAPGWPTPYAHLAAVQSRLGSENDAIGTLRRGIQATNDALPLVVKLAGLYEHLGRADQAIGEYERFLKRDADSAVVANNLAMLLATYRSDPSSLDQARQLSRRFAASPETAFVDTWGWVSYKSGDTADALSALQRAASEAPHEPLILYHLAMAQVRVGERDAARENLEEALKSGDAFAGRDEAERTLAALARQSAARSTEPPL